MTTTDYTIEGRRLFHAGRDTGITFARTSNHHWELSVGTEPAGAYMDFRRAFIAACERAAHDLAASG